MPSSNRTLPGTTIEPGNGRIDGRPRSPTRPPRIRMQMVEALVGEDLQLLGQLEAGLVVVDPSGLVVHWNDRAERLLGRAADQALGRRWQDCVVLVRGGGATPRKIRAAAGQPGGWNGQMRVRISRGRVLAFQAHVQPVRESTTAALALQTREAQMLRDLAGLPSITNDPTRVQQIAERALQVVAEA